MNQLPANFRRLMSLTIPVVSALAFFGIITAITKIEITENLISSGITLSVIFGISQVGLWYMIYKGRT